MGSVTSGGPDEPLTLHPAVGPPLTRGLDHSA
jgi:hypothetical protein